MFVEKSKEVRTVVNILISILFIALQLRDRWLAVIAKAGGDQAEVDGLSWLSKATLDIIGLTGS